MMTVGLKRLLFAQSHINGSGTGVELPVVRQLKPALAHGADADVCVAVFEVELIVPVAGRRQLKVTVCANGCILGVSKWHTVS